MNKTRIIGAIMLATGTTVEVFAKKHGYSKVAFYNVIKRKHKTPAIRQIISDLVDIPVSELWPKQEDICLHPTESEASKASQEHIEPLQTGRLLACENM